MGELRNDGHEIVRFGRKSADVLWTLGVYPEPEVLSELDALIHFAWSTRDRTHDAHLNIGGTWRLAQLSKIVGVPFLFISSVAAQSQSRYGQSKLKAESLVFQENGFVSRFGLIMNGNNYDIKLVSKIFFLTGNTQIYRTSILDAANHIREWLSNCNYECLNNNPKIVLTDHVSVSQHFKGHGAKVGVSMEMLILFIRIGSIFSIKMRNFDDALKSIQTLKIKNENSK